MKEHCNDYDLRMHTPDNTSTGSQFLCEQYFEQNHNKYFELKTRGVPMGRPKLELFASNGVHICHAI